MDFNGMSPQGYPLSGVPVGFGMALAMNEPAMKAYAQLTETQREHIIMRCKDAQSKEEMRQIVDSLVPDGNISSLYEHTDETAEG